MNNSRCTDSVLFDQKFTKPSNTNCGVILKRLMQCLAAWGVLMSTQLNNLIRNSLIYSKKSLPLYTGGYLSTSIVHWLVQIDFFRRGVENLKISNSRKQNITKARTQYRKQCVSKWRKID